MLQVRKPGMSDFTHCCVKNTWQLKGRVYCDSENGEIELLHYGAEDTKSMNVLVSAIQMEKISADSLLRGIHFRTSAHGTVIPMFHEGFLTSISLNKTSFQTWPEQCRAKDQIVTISNKHHTR